MKHREVLGVCAPAPRLTFAGLFLVASAFALPVGVALLSVEWLWL